MSRIEFCLEPNPSIAFVRWTLGDCNSVGTWRKLWMCYHLFDYPFGATSKFALCIDLWGFLWLLVKKNYWAVPSDFAFLPVALFILVCMHGYSKSEGVLMTWSKSILIWGWLPLGTICLLFYCVIFVAQCCLLALELLVLKNITALSMLISILDWEGI